MYITGDLHGSVKRITEFLDSLQQYQGIKNRQSLHFCILGDVGINFYLDQRDAEKKQILQDRIEKFMEKMGIEVDILFVRGNHDCRPGNIYSYKEIDKYGGRVYVEEEYPNLIFLKDGELYEIENQKYLVIGGGKSNDFFQRLLEGSPFFHDEEYTEEEFEAMMKNVQKKMGKGTIVLSHMLPISFSPRIEKCATEKHLESVIQEYESYITKWYAGHYHMELKSKKRGIDIQILYKNIVRY